MTSREDAEKIIPQKEEEEEGREEDGRDRPVHCVLYLLPVVSRVPDYDRRDDSRTYGCLAV